MQAMARQVKPLPPGLWDYLLACETGFVAIGTRQSNYIPGQATVRHRRLHNVAYVSIEDLARDNELPLHVLGHLIDHLLGCKGDPLGPWLSSGGGMTARWREAGQRLPRLFALGYAVDDTAQASVRDYFAQSLSLYCRDRHRLNVADPQIVKWFRSTLWDDSFWRIKGQANNQANGG